MHAGIEYPRQELSDPFRTRRRSHHLVENHRIKPLYIIYFNKAFISNLTKKLLRLCGHEVPREEKLSLLTKRPKFELCDLWRLTRERDVELGENVTRLSKTRDLLNAAPSEK